MSSASIPLLKNPPDSMLHGPNGHNFAADAVQGHPIDRMQRARQSTNFSLNLDDIRRLYGSAFAMRLATERSLAAQVGGRLPGMDATSNSNLMLETLTGDDTLIDFADFLNVEQFRPEPGRMTRSGPHSAMEARLGL